MSRTTLAAPTSKLLSERDMEMLAAGRKMEREDVIRDLEALSRKHMKANPEYSLNMGFVVEMLRAIEERK